MAEQGAGGSRNGRRTSSRPPRTAKPSPAALARRASAELAELLGREPEGVISLERTEDGWRIGVEVVETRRIPDTADILAEYEVDADERGRLVGYRRARRYARGATKDDR
ncbi:MAG: hypothetical protein QOG01_1633 [Pseudonocardiales bacterium]|jgi:hypothetical protein|nr:hypothetical protein [Pseudonocardiales bacterium]